jgi:uncharacterized protein YndB with AHSA1/START domain
MSVKKEESGRRSIQVEVEVPGTPEQVWQAIATGPGVSAWFVPTEVDGREGGSVTANFGPGMDSVATVTAWDPPRRFAAESPDLGPEAPLVATEWIVEARSGGTCVVRVVNSLFASVDDWDNQLESFEGGWPAWFRILRLYLTHFAGQRGASFRLMGFVDTSEAAAWEDLAGPLGLAGVTKDGVGQHWSTGGGATPFSGVIEGIGEDGKHMTELYLEEPAPGLAFLFAHLMGEKVYVAVNFFFYGDGAADAVAKLEPLWQAWMQERFGAAEVTC